LLLVITSEAQNWILRIISLCLKCAFKRNENGSILESLPLCYLFWDTSNTFCILQACQSLDPKQRFLCNDHEGRISYLSTQQATQHDVATLVHQACIRSLSCEVRIKQSHVTVWLPSCPACHQSFYWLHCPGIYLLWNANQVLSPHH